MFPWDQTKRRVLATFVLVIASICPVVVVAVSVWSLTRPGHLRDVEVEVSRLLEADVSIRSVRHPKPGVDDYRGVLVRARPGAKSEFTLERPLQIGRLVVTRENATILLRAEDLQVPCEELDHLVEFVDLLAHYLGPNTQRLSLHAPTATLVYPQDEARTFALDDVALVLNRRDRGEHTSLSFRLNSPEAPSRHELTLVRDQKANHTVCEVRLETMEGGLPLGQLGLFSQAVDWLGERAKLQGTLLFSRCNSGGEWDVLFRGRILDIAFDRLITGHFSHHEITGMATLEIAHARWAGLPGHQGRGWVEVEGELRSGPGTMGLEFMNALAREMRFEVDRDAVQGALANVRFESLGLRFRLTSDGQLRLVGSPTPGLPPQTVGVDAAHAPFLRAPNGLANVRGLWNVLFPQSDEVLVPATAESQVMRHLPLPTESAGTRTSIQAN
jgi:hypothetical protein